MTGARWQFDKRVSLGNIIVAVVNIVAGIVFVVSMNFRINDVQTEANDLKLWRPQIEARMSAVETRDSVLEADARNATSTGLQFEADTKASLNKLQDQQTAILQAIASLAASMTNKGAK